MVVSHEAWIVALSVLVAIQGAYVGLKPGIAASGSSGEIAGCQRRRFEWLLTTSGKTGCPVFSWGSPD
jgi:NO-binding membrane sensor protein with MHYT domain